MNNNNIFIPDLKYLIRKLPQILLLYFFIFQPPFIGRSSYFLIEFLFFILFVLLKPKLFLSTFSKFKIESFLFILIILYTIFRDLFKGEEVYFFRMISWCFQSFFFSIIIVAYFNNKIKNNNLYPDLLSLSFWAVIIAGFASFSLLINNSLNNIYNSLIIVDPINFSNVRILRGYGIAENLTFTYSYLLGIFTGYIFYILKYRAWYIIFIPILVTGIIFNARIGFLPIIIFIILLMSKIYYKRLLFITFLISIIIIFLPQFEIYHEFEKNRVWVTSAFKDLFTIFTDIESLDKSSSLSVLLFNFRIFPTTTSGWVFGNGINLFLSKTHSDIGYINQLYYGGILYLILLFSLYFYMVRRLKFNYGLTNWFVFLFTLSILILNFKGSAFASTPGSRFLYMGYVYMIINSLQSDQKIS